jgi:MoaA/NifB/PqqE/SkfB family radical SAM enzyme
MCSNTFEYKYTGDQYHIDIIKQRIDSFASWDDRNFHRFPDMKDDWTITGGEPTLNPHYFEILSYIREKFPNSRLVQLTHGDRFANEEFTKKISTLENYHLVFPVHWYNAQTHEAIVRKKWAWNELLKWIYNVLKYKKYHNQTLEIRFIIQGQNFRHLDKMYEVIHKYFPNIDSIVTVMMEFEWQAIDNIKLTKMSYKKVMDINEKVFLKWGEKFWIQKFRLYHFPLCTVQDTKLWKYLWRTLPSHEITFTGKCSACKLSKYCMGIHEAYCEFNGEDEIKPFLKKDIQHIKIIENKDNFRFQPIADIKDAWAGKKTVIFVWYACDNICRFCIDLNKREINRTTQEVLKDILVAKQNGTEILEIIGGEVTIRKDFFTIMKFIKSCNFRHSYLVTNGNRLANKEFAQKLYDLQVLDSIVFSIHGSTPELHNLLTATPKSYEKLLLWIKNWQELWFPKEKIGTNTAIESGNFHDLVNLGKLIKELWCFGSSEFIFADPNQWGVNNEFEKLMPRISEAAPKMRELLDWWNANGMIYRVRYVPLCYFPEYLEDNISEIKETQIYTNVTHSAPDFHNSDVVEWRKNTGRVRTKKCQNCSLFEKCEWIWKTYYEKWWDDELHPIW